MPPKNQQRYLSVKVHPQRPPCRVEEREDIFHIYISCAPEKGKANKEVISLLGKYLGCSRKNLEIIKGKKNREKIVLWIP